MKRFFSFHTQRLKFIFQWTSNFLFRYLVSISCRTEWPLRCLVGKKCAINLNVLILSTFRGQSRKLGRRKTLLLLTSQDLFSNRLGWATWIAFVLCELLFLIVAMIFGKPKAKIKNYHNLYLILRSDHQYCIELYFFMSMGSIKQILLGALKNNFLHC